MVGDAEAGTVGDAEAGTVGWLAVVALAVAVAEGAAVAEGVVCADGAAGDEHPAAAARQISPMTAPAGAVA
jgi:hypothetical protein